MLLFWIAMPSIIIILSVLIIMVVAVIGLTMAVAIVVVTSLRMSRHLEQLEQYDVKVCGDNS